MNYTLVLKVTSPKSSPAEKHCHCRDLFGMLGTVTLNLTFEGFLLR